MVMLPKHLISIPAAQQMKKVSTKDSLYPQPQHHEAQSWVLLSVGSAEPWAQCGIRSHAVPRILLRPPLLSCCFAQPQRIPLGVTVPTRPPLDQVTRAMNKGPSAFPAEDGLWPMGTLEVAVSQPSMVAVTILWRRTSHIPHAAGALETPQRC